MKETKVYIDELPKSCWDCPCFDSYELQCQINYADCENLDIAIERHKDCPLHSIKDHDRELVAKVCEKIRQEITKNASYDIEEPIKVVSLLDVNETIDKKQKEYEK